MYFLVIVLVMYLIVTSINFTTTMLAVGTLILNLCFSITDLEIVEVRFFLLDVKLNEAF